MKIESRLRIGAQLSSLLAVSIRVEDEASCIEALQQHHANIRQAAGIDGG